MIILLTPMAAKRVSTSKLSVLLIRPQIKDAVSKESEEDKFRFKVNSDAASKYHIYFP